MLSRLTWRLKAKKELFAGLDYRGVPVLAAYRHVEICPGKGWGLVVKLDEKEVLQPIWEGLFQSVLLVLAACAGGAALIGLVSQRISQPIEAMSGMAREVQAGDLDVRAAVTGPRELRILAETGNAMLDRMCDWGRDLEDQVRARTSELSSINASLEAEIAERTLTELALRESAAIQILFETAADAIFIIDAEPGSCGTIVSANPAAAQMHGYCLEELLKLRMDDLNTPHFARHVRDRIAAIYPWSAH